MAGHPEANRRYNASASSYGLPSPPGLEMPGFRSDTGKGEGPQGQSLQEGGIAGHNFQNLETYLMEQEEFFRALDAEEMNQVGKGAAAKGSKGSSAKGYSPWSGAGLIAAKARSAWRSVASASSSNKMTRRDDPKALDPSSTRQSEHQASVPSVKSGASAPWQAVWCHERCHKTDAATLRAQLQLIMAQHHGELVCQKTAGKLKLWLDDRKGSSNNFYVLLSDWRQLKPCMDILAEEAAEQPAAVILLCEQPKGLAKAQLWNDSRPATSFPLFFLTNEGASWVQELEQIIGSVKQSSAPWAGPSGSSGPSSLPFFDAVRAPLSTRFSL